MDNTVCWFQCFLTDASFTDILMNILAMNCIDIDFFFVDGAGL